MTEKFTMKKIDHKRKQEFRIETSISHCNQERVLVKRAVNQESLEFLKKIPESERIAEVFFLGHAKVIKGILNDNQLYYPYVNYPSLEQLIAHVMENDNCASSVSLIEEYIGFLNRLPSKTCVPLEFYEDLKIKVNCLPEPVHCLLAAPIDCIPCNILVNSNSWYAIDNEWTREYPIPLAYIIYRGVVSLVSHLQEIIKYRTSNEHPVVLYSGYGNNRIWIPLQWLHWIQSAQIPLKIMDDWEYSFQKKVLSTAYRSHLRLRSKPNVISKIKPTQPYVSLVLSLIRKFGLFIKVL